MLLSYGSLPELLCQERILLSRILEITLQIEARSREEEILLEDLPERREIYIGRFKKCREAVSRCVSALPEPEKSRIKNILSGKGGDPAPGNEESGLRETVRQCRLILRQTLRSDREARRKISEQCGRIRSRIHPSRRTYP